jgi:hypothetical protein
MPRQGLTGASSRTAQHASSSVLLGQPALPGLAAGPITRGMLASIPMWIGA